MVQKQIELTEDQARELADLARQRGISETEVMRAALEELVRKSERARLKEAAKAIVGKYSSGIPDLAVNHDKYLAEAYEA